jgi:hypothetical protein
VVKKCVSRLSSEKFNLNWCQSFSIILSEGPNFASVQKTGESQCITYFYCWKFLDPSWFKRFFKFPLFEQILLVFVGYIFIFIVKIAQPRYLKFFTCYKHLLSTINLHLVLKMP